MDYSSLNKACSKDLYPFSEEGEELASLMGYPYKCFLRLPKEYSQIRMAEDDKENIGFHTEEGVYCFTHMVKELKNSAAILQRMMEKDVKETLRKLRRVNIKIDPTMSSFGVMEGKFLGHMPLSEAQTRMETAKEAGWMNEAKEALQRIKRKLGTLQTLAISKEGETLMLCLRQRMETISSSLLIEMEGIQILVYYVS
ncbi:hypothetical protein Tco_0044863 [Tanacetum coccineum]